MVGATADQGRDLLRTAGPSRGAVEKRRLMDQALEVMGLSETV